MSGKLQAPYFPLETPIVALGCVRKDFSLNKYNKFRKELIKIAHIFSAGIHPNVPCNLRAIDVEGFA